VSRSNYQSEQAMTEYLDALLLEEEPAPVDFDDSPVRALLERATPKIQTLKPEPVSEPEPALKTEPALTPEPERAPEPESVPDVPESVAEQDFTQTEVAKATETAVDADMQDDGATPPPTDAMMEYQENDFQALFFKVAGLTLAVPLKSLGGIHTLGKISPLFGKPHWFKGIMNERGNKLQAVDTARWVMPEKLTAEVEDGIKYEYMITLSDSPWGLLCEELVDSEALQPDAIQWRNGPNQKRPWLAGVVRNRMCALLDVNELIKLLDKGLGHTQNGPHNESES